MALAKVPYVCQILHIIKYVQNLIAKKINSVLFVFLIVTFLYIDIQRKFDPWKEESLQRFQSEKIMMYKFIFIRNYMSKERRLSKDEIY
jgi:hypothetical protein